VVRPRAGDCSPELVLGAMSSGASGGDFIGMRGEWWPGLEPQGKA
jgi:hypothetical protein